MKVNKQYLTGMICSTIGFISSVMQILILSLAGVAVTIATNIFKEDMTISSVTITSVIEIIIIGLLYLFYSILNYRFLIKNKSKGPKIMMIIGIVYMILSLLVFISLFLEL